MSDRHVEQTQAARAAEDIRVTIGTLVLPSSSLAAASRAAVGLQRELSGLLARPDIEFVPGDRAVVVETARSDGVAAAVHRAIAGSSEGAAP